MKACILTAALALFTCLFAGMPAGTSYAADLQSPVGLWKTVDDKTGRPRAMVFTPGAETRVCAVCSDERKDQPIIGLLIIRNVTLRDGEYGGGDILDPDTGSVYRCKFHLEKDGTVLVVRGFIGISLLGRSQTWQRES